MPYHQKLYAKIRKQMEFYFSDSNLVKDKFLHDLIIKDPDGYVDLETFKNFNKIKALTDNTEVIVSAVSRSSMFEISKDQKRVRRVTALELSKDFDACTLYVERLPQNADQKWVKDVFGHFGCVRYVNVPRFKATNKIKGFAFVEFDDPEGVKKACEHDESELEESKTKRRRTNSKKHRSNAERPSLRVMPKSEWKTYRNKYLEIQRSTMSILKKQILFETQEVKEQECNTKLSDVAETKKSL